MCFEKVSAEASAQHPSLESKKAEMSNWIASGRRCNCIYSKYRGKRRFNNLYHGKLSLFFLPSVQHLSEHLHTPAPRERRLALHRDRRGHVGSDGSDNRIQFGIMLSAPRRHTAAHMDDSTGPGSRQLETFTGNTFQKNAHFISSTCRRWGSWGQHEDNHRTPSCH